MNKVKKYKSVTKQITFPEQLMDRAQVRASSLGYSFPAYVRYVLAKEVEEKLYPVLDGVVIDDDMVESMKKDLKDSREGKLKELKNFKDIEVFCRGILEDEK